MSKATSPYFIQSYTFIIHEAEEGGYWGEILELPGCVSQGETLEELRQNIKEAIDAVLSAQAYEAHGEFHVYSGLVAREIAWNDVCDTYTIPNKTWTTAY